MHVHKSIKPLLFRSPSSPHTQSLHLKLHFKSIDNWQKKSKKEEFHPYTKYAEILQNSYSIPTWKIWRISSSVN